MSTHSIVFPELWLEDLLIKPGPCILSAEPSPGPARPRHTTPAAWCARRAGRGPRWSGSAGARPSWSAPPSERRGWRKRPSGIRGAPCGRLPARVTWGKRTEGEAEGCIKIETERDSEGERWRERKRGKWRTRTRSFVTNTSSWIVFAEW